MTPALNPSAAYRLDVGTASRLGSSDGAWLLIAHELRLAASGPGEIRRNALYTAIGAAIDLLGEAHVEAHSEREWQRDLGYVEALMVLAETMQDAGAPNLAAVMLDDLLVAAADDLTPTQRGRILVQRARVEWKRGRLDEAAERYAFVERLGKRAKSGELVARAALGLTAIAQQRGNYPEMGRQAERALKLARKHGVRSVERLAHFGLMVVAAGARDLDRALAEGWRVLELSRGENDWESEILQSLGQLLLERGEPNAARACFAAVMERTSLSRVLLPALGGLARASAVTGREPTVEWATREVWRARSGSAPRYAVAAALLECATALAGVGRAADSTRFRAEAAAMAAASGFHEVAYRAEEVSIAPSAAESRVYRGLDEMIQTLEALEPARLPEELHLEAAPA